MSTLTIFAGINGAGKSTLYNFYSSNTNLDLGERICPDEILKEFSDDWRDRDAIMKSGYETLRRIEDCLETKRSFNWETTLISGLTIDFIKRAKSAGFRVVLNFIGVGDLNQALDRIKLRVFKGGHGIDEKIVEARFKNQFNKLGEALHYIDTALFYDNTKTMKVVGAYYDKQLDFYDTKTKWVKDLFLPSQQILKHKKDNHQDT